MKRVPMSEILEDEEMARIDGMPFTGIAFELVPVASEVTFVSGVQEGPARDSYSDGRRKGVTWFQRGTKHGREREWHQTGSLALEAKYEFGILLEKTTWSETGDLLEHYVLPPDDPLRNTLRLFRASKRTRILATLGETLDGIEELPWNHALYLPSDGDWDRDTTCAVLDPDDCDDDEDAPETARNLGLEYALSVQAVQSIVKNARQKGIADGAGVLKAFHYYFENDAFLPEK